MVIFDISLNATTKFSSRPSASMCNYLIPIVFHIDFFLHPPTYLCLELFSACNHIMSLIIIDNFTGICFLFRSGRPNFLE